MRIPSSWQAWELTSAQPAQGNIDPGHILFRGKVPVSDGSDTFQASQAVRDLAMRLFNENPKPEWCFSVDATRNPQCVTIDGGVDIARHLLSEVQGRLKGKGPFTEIAYVAVQYPDEASVRLMADVVDKANRILKPGTFDFLNKGLHLTMRKLTGIRGDLDKIRWARDPDDPRRVVLRFALKGVSASDLSRTAQYLHQAANLIR